MKSFFLVFLMAAVGCIFSGAASADQAEEVKALVEKAVALAEKDGMAKTLKLIGNRMGPFVKEMLYVWAGDFDNTTVLAFRHSECFFCATV